MTSNQDINVLQVVSWLKLVFPGKYISGVCDETYHISMKCDDSYHHVGFLYEELGIIYLCIDRAYFGRAVNSIILDLKTEFSLSARYTKINGYTKEIYYVYKINFKE